MLNRVKLVLSTMALCCGFSFSAIAEEAESESGANNSVVILLCSVNQDSGAEPKNGSDPESNYVVMMIDPIDFSAVGIDEGDDCAISVAKMNHYGWQTQTWGFDTELLGFILQKQ